MAKLTNEQKKESLEMWKGVKLVAAKLGLKIAYVYDFCGSSTNRSTQLRRGQTKAPAGWKEKLKQLYAQEVGTDGKKYIE